MLWKMGFSGAKIVPCPPYTPLGAIESSRGLRPSRALRGFFDSLSSPFRRAFALCRICLPLDRDGLQCERRGSPTKNSETRTCGSRFRALSRGSRQRRLMISRKLLEIRRIQELQSMVPEFVDSTGGSRWVQAQPAGASPSRDKSRQRRPVISRKLLEIRRIWELQSMVPEFVA